MRMITRSHLLKQLPPIHDDAERLRALARYGIQ
jgi:hypothetical protein